jgi:hypothetical protein
MPTWNTKAYFGMHNEVKRFLKTVSDGGGTIVEARWAVLNQLVTDLKAASVWNRLHDFWFPVGDFTACFYKLKSYPGAGVKLKNMGWNGGTWVQDNAQSFQSGDWVETGATGGLTPTGATKSLDTGVQVGMIGQVGGLAFYLCEVPDATSRGFIGADDSASTSNRFFLGRFSAGNNTGGAWGTVQFAQENPQNLGHHQLVRSSNTLLKYYRNGVALGGTGTNLTDVTPINTSHIHRWWAYSFGNDDVPNATWALNKRGAGYAITEALTDTDVLNFHNAVQTAQTSLGRNV